MPRNQRLNPANKNPVRVVERPSEAEPEHGHAIALSPTPNEHSRRAEWMRLLWQERSFIGRTTILGLIFSLVVAFLLPVQYKSKMRLMPPEQQSGSGLAMLAALAGRGSSTSSGSGVAGALGGSLGSVAGDLLGVKSSGALFVDMLDGTTIQDDLIERFDLRKVYHTTYWEDARRALAKQTDMKEDRKSGVITITVTDHDPKRAQALAQAYVDALNRIVAQVSISSARRQRIFIEGRLQTVKQNLDAALQDFSQYASKNGTFDMPSQTKAMVDSEAGLQGQLIAAEAELEGLKQTYTDNNIRVRTLDARVAALKRQVENMSGNKADLNSDQSEIAGDFPSIRKLPLVGVRWANLYRESKIQETLYELLTQEYEFAKIQEAREIPTVNVLDAALLPENKSFPPRTVIVAGGALLSVLFAGVLVITAAMWKRSQSPEKQLATEIWRQIGAENTRSRAKVQIMWSRFGGRNGTHHGHP